VDAVLSVDGIPVIIPLMYEDDRIVELLESLDGIIFTGGEDFDPSYYDETPIPHMNRINAPRDMFDIKLLRLAVKHGIPVLGICRGVQLINIAYGGSLYQDLSAQYPDKSIKHRQTLPKEDASHAVIVEDGTVFADMVRERMLMVNSSHHQAIKKLADGFRVAGTSPDKIIEAIEKVDSAHWIVGVQFHPEVMINNSPSMRRIFKGFIGEASRLKSEKQQPLRADVVLSVESADEHAPFADVSVPDITESPEENDRADILTPNVNASDNSRIDYPNLTDGKTDTRTSKVRRRDEMRKFKEKEKQHSKEQKEQENLDRQTRKEKERQEKEDFNEWMQQKKLEEKEAEKQAKIAKEEQSEKTEAAKKEVAEKEKLRQKEQKEAEKQEKTAKKEAAKKEKLEKKEAEKQAETAKREAAGKEKSAKKEAVEKEKQRQKELKEAEKQKKTLEKEAAETEKAAKKEAERKEKQYKKEQKERAKTDKKELKKMEKQKKAEEKEKGKMTDFIPA
jgi:gamma-glutamyl-gamma-aminobutyrate hydrolase PuuD